MIPPLCWLLRSRLIKESDLYSLKTCPICEIGYNAFTPVVIYVRATYPTWNICNNYLTHQ